MSDMAMNFSDLGQVGKASLGTGIAGGALSGLLDIGNFISNQIYAKQDREFRDKVYEETKEREDSAVQRRVADLAKAGLSPLAEMSGSSASAGGSSVSASLPASSHAGNAFRGVFDEATGANLKIHQGIGQQIDNYNCMRHLSNLQAKLENEKANFLADTARANLDKLYTIIEKELMMDPKYEQAYTDMLKAQFESTEIQNRLANADTWGEYVTIGFEVLLNVLKLAEGSANMVDRFKGSRKKIGF